MHRQAPLPRQKSLVTPEIVNPFVHTLNLGVLEMIQIAIMSVTIAPLRLLFVAIFLVCAWILAEISLAFRPKEDKSKPLSGWRKSINGPMGFLGRSIGFVLGFHKVKVKGRPASAADAPMIIAAPHSTFFDAICFFYCDSIPSSVSKRGNSTLPILGSLIEFTQPVFVEREDPNSRVNTIKEIQRRAQSGGKWPQVIIFPEGTCTNRTCLINFKPGAFYPGAPVQPVCIRYTNALDTFTWTWDGPDAYKCFWFTLCQFNNSMEIEFLPVYYPTEEDKKDPKLFADNVREKMAECLDVPVTDHSYDDCRLMQKAAKMKLPKAAGLVEFQKLNKKIGIKFDEINELFDKFCAISREKEVISLDEFASYLHLPKSEALEEVFSLYDRDGSGTIDFREYVIGLSIVATPANTEETVKLAFELFDEGKKGYITQEELQKILHNAFNLDELDAEELFNEVDTNGDGRIGFDEFHEYSLQKPEYAKIFTTYHSQKTNGNSHLKGE